MFKKLKPKRYDRCIAVIYSFRLGERHSIVCKHHRIGNSNIRCTLVYVIIASVVHINQYIRLRFGGNSFIQHQLFFTTKSYHTTKLHHFVLVNAILILVLSWVAGGERIYKEALQHDNAVDVHLTHIDVSVGKRVAKDADIAYFPQDTLESSDFREVSRSTDGICTFCLYKRPIIQT